MKIKIWALSGFSCLLFLTVGAAFAENQDQVEVLTQAQWNVPRSSDTIVTIKPIYNSVRKYESLAGSNIQIRYAGGDEGTLWAYDLRGWLVSLGIPSGEIELIPGASSPGQLELTVISPQ